MKVRPRLRLAAGLVAIYAISTSFFLIVPPNANSDELWSARAAWFLYENPKILFEDSKIVTYEFPGSLSIPGEVLGRGIPHPCFFEKVHLPASCQAIRSDDYSFVGQFDRVFRSAPFYFAVGFGMKSGVLDNAYLSGKLTALLLNLSILTVSILLLRKIFNNIQLVLSLGISALPIYVFSLNGISPISFEISCGFLFVAALIRCSNEPNYWNYSVCLGSILLLGAARPLGAVWGMLLLISISLLVRTTRFLRNIVVVGSAISLFFQSQIDNYTFRFGDGNRYRINATPEFYIEELIRVIINSGNWVRQIFGMWTFAGSVELPFLFLMLSVFSSFLVVSRYFHRRLLSATRFILIVVLMPVFAVPLLFSLLWANQWPMWWSGRYGLPYILPMLFVLALNLKLPDLILPSIFSLTILFVAVIFNWARFNWGLYPNSTPIIQNTQAFSVLRNSIIIFSILAYLFLSANNLYSVIRTSTKSAPKS